jgi:hypothetical protein
MKAEWQVKEHAMNLTIVLPLAFVGEGEPGDEFTHEFKAWLRALGADGWWPVDFGEGDNENIELWLVKEQGDKQLRTDVMVQIDHFILMGGDV